MTTYAVDGQCLDQVGLAGQAPQSQATQIAYAGNEAAWANAHNEAIGFTGNEDVVYNTKNGPMSVQQMGVAITIAGYNQPGNYSLGAIIAAYQNATGGPVTPASSVPANPSGSGVGGSNSGTGGNNTGASAAGMKGGGAIPPQQGSVGNVENWFKADTRVAGHAVPNWLLAGTTAGLAWYVIFRKKRR